MDDLTVVKRCLGGRNESFTHIVTRYKDRIFRYITSFVYDREEARDLAQETFVKKLNTILNNSYNHFPNLP